MKNAAYGILLICVLAVWMDCIQAGSSFLSPSLRPQGKEKKPPRVGRRDSEGILDLFGWRPNEEEDNQYITFTTPFEIGISMTEKEYQQYGEGLQKIVQDVLMNNPSTG
ncbi:hypothetical protein JZ751_014744 [Albula glossodonta]|uniref:Motilin/ghrelin-associated peptide domain-containing protein n=1 Tax=Albula glossodonta TaxID=121402 RepID=A0A8T2MYI4_9TELE|nr:hypothetical protein JZ751_014744 [Albula glossodonta]